ALYYTQYQDGVEVYGTRLTLLVRNEPNHPLVLAGAALRDLGGFRVAPGRVNAIKYDAAFSQVRARFGKDAQFSEVRPVVWAGLEEMAAQPALAVEFVSEGGDPLTGDFHKIRFITDAETGEILHAENLILHVDVSGQVLANASTGHGADICYPTAIMPM